MGIRSALLEPVFGSATAAARELREWDAAVRVPLPLCRRLGFVHLDPGSGATTTAAEVATVLAGRRAGMVLAVDASTSPAGPLDRIGLGPLGAPVPPGATVPPGFPIPPGAPVPPGATVPPAAPVVRGAAAVRATARTAAEARAGLGRTRGGYYALDLHPDPPASPHGMAAAWSAGVGPVGRFYDVVATDWGPRHPAYDLEPVLSSSHAVCLVVRAEDAAVAAAAELLSRLATRPATPPVVVALVAVDRGARTARRLPGPAVGVPYEPRPHRPGRPYRTAVLRLAALLMTDPGADRDR